VPQDRTLIVDERARDVPRLAATLVAAVRCSNLYPSDHPVVGAAVSRFVDAVRDVTLGTVLSVGITPDSLLIDGAPGDLPHLAIAEAATLLHDCDLLELIFFGEVPPQAIDALLRVLTLDGAERRRRGGPAKIWSTTGHPSIALVQIDYTKVLAVDEDQVAEPARRDDLWRSIVMSVCGGRSASLDASAQQRFMAIAGSPADLAELATTVIGVQCAMDGSPMISSQAATLLSAFRQLTSIASVISPDRLPHIMSNITAAVMELDPHVIIELLQIAGDDSPDSQSLAHLSSAFDDGKLARLFATALALDGRVSERLLTVFNRIAPDEDRKRRMLSLARTLLSETELGRSRNFQELWTAAEQLLVRYDDTPYVSEAYRAALDGIGSRAESMAGGLPPELPGWMETLGSSSLRSLSVTLLIDLLRIEHLPARASDLVKEMEALTEDLLLSGAYQDAGRIAGALRSQGDDPDAIGRDGSLRALDRLGESVAMREVAASIEEMDDDSWRIVREMAAAIGISVVDTLKVVIIVEEETVASRRAEDVVVGFGAPAITRLASLVADPRWWAQLRAARILRRIAAVEGVPMLRLLLRQGDARVIPDAVSALCRIEDDSATRAIHIVVRTASSDLRRLVVDALVTNRDPRVIPVIVRVIETSLPLGKDHHVVLDLLSVFGIIGNDQAVPALVAISQQRAFFRRRRLRALREAAIDALARIGGAPAATALEAAARDGDSRLKKIVAARLARHPRPTSPAASTPVPGVRVTE
jgi:HEAT repeat protein